MLYTFLLMLVMAVEVFVLLCRDAKNLKLQSQIRPAVHQGGKALLRLKTSGSCAFLATAYVLLKLNIHREIMQESSGKKTWYRIEKAMIRVKLSLNHMKSERFRISLKSCFQIPGRWDGKYG